MPEAALHVGSGKVRELYALDDERLLLVASDRISTFDVVLPTEIPDKGRVLTGLSGLLVRAHARHRARTTCSRCARTAARPSAAGSRCCRSSASSAATSPARAGRTTARRGAVCGHALPAGLVESEQLPGADLHARDEGARRATTRTSTASRRPSSSARSASPRSSASRSRSTASRRSTRRARGIIIADTKFEFGLDEDGRLVLADEALTPDSSRFWPADEYAPGGAAAVVRQAVRARLLRVARLGQDRARARSCPTTSSPARARATSRRSSG